MEQTIHISELVRGSSVYDTDNNTIIFSRVHIMPNISLVKYEFDGNEFIDVWICKNGVVPNIACMEPTHSLIAGGSDMYYPMSQLLDAAPVQDSEVIL